MPSILNFSKLKSIPNGPLLKSRIFSNATFSSSNQFLSRNILLIKFTYLFIDEIINFLQWFAVHILRKRFEFLWQHVAILDSRLRPRMEAILTHQLNVTILMFDLRFLCVGNDLMFGNWKIQNKQQKQMMK